MVGAARILAHWATKTESELLLSRLVLPAGALTLGRTFVSRTSPEPSSKQPKTPYFVSTPIYYVNGEPHIGHASSSILADALARWQRIRKFVVQPPETWKETYETAPDGGVYKEDPVIFSTGTDEHGAKVQEAAEKAGFPSDQVATFCEGVSRKFQAMTDLCGVSYSEWIRTTDPDHIDIVGKLWRKLESEGHIYYGEWNGWYSVDDEEYLTDGQVMKGTDPKTGEIDVMVSRSSGRRVTKYAEMNHRFRLTAFKDRILDWLQTPGVVIPESRKHDIVAMVTSEDFGDLSVSRKRSKVPWGIAVPSASGNDVAASAHDLHDPEVIYVWLDALVNYLTVAHRYHNVRPASSTEERDENELLPTTAWPPTVHVVGKDIARFHGVYWPAFLLGAGLPLPNHLVVHGHWLSGGRKMSKSAGNVVDPAVEIERLGRDAFRYYLLRDQGMADDGDYTQNRANEVRKGILGDGLGNLVQRITAPRLMRHLDPIAPFSCLLDRDGAPQLASDTLSKAQVIESHAKKAAEYIDDIRWRAALAEVEQMVSMGNAHVQFVAPWTLAKQLDGVDDSESAEAKKLRRELAETTYLQAELLRMTSALLLPVMPDIARRILLCMNLDPDVDQGMLRLNFGVLPAATVQFHAPPKVLFPMAPKQPKQQKALKKKAKGTVKTTAI
eukprot:Clim_evm16s64 gene=Clim_evmTU16s64